MATTTRPTGTLKTIARGTTRTAGTTRRSSRETEGSSSSVARKIWLLGSRHRSFFLTPLLLLLAIPAILSSRLFRR